MNKKGRKKGVKNLVSLPNGNLLNQNGVEFTKKEKRDLEYAVKKANAKRKEMLKLEASLPRTILGEKIGDTVASRQRMNFESEFVLKHKTMSLQRYKTREEYTRYMNYLKNVNKEDYITNRLRLYKRNFNQALDDVYGDMAKDVKMKVRMMKPKDFYKILVSDEDLDIQFIYPNNDEDLTTHLNKIRTILGMKLKEE